MQVMAGVKSVPVIDFACLSRFFSPHVYCDGNHLQISKDMGAGFVLLYVTS